MVAFLFHLKMAFLKVITTTILVFYTFSGNDFTSFQSCGSDIGGWKRNLHVIMVILAVK